MKRTLVVSIVALIVIILLSACGQEPVTVVVTATPAPATATSAPSTATPSTDTGSSSADSATSEGETGTDSSGSTTAESVELPEQMSPSPDATGPAADAGRLAFMGPYGNNFQVFVANADGSGLRMVSDGQTESLFPSLSPDGTRVAYAASVGENDLDLIITDLESGESTSVTQGADLDNQPVWSPDGEQIAFISNRDGSFGIFVMDADGANIRRVTDLPSQAFSPLGGWSPDGSKIVYGAETDSGARAIQIVDVESGEIEPLTNHSGEEANPVWSPNGERIAFHSDRPAPQNLEVFVMNADGDNLRAATNLQGPALFPSWGPDSEWLAFTVVDAQQNLTLNQMPADGGPVHRLQDANGDLLQGIITSWVATSEPLEDTGFSQTPTFEISAEVLDSAPTRGDPNAPITIVEFSDYECPFCKQFYDNTLSQIEQYVEDGTVRFMWVDFPLTNIHPQARKAALAARCVADQGGDDAYWQMHNALFESQEQWGGEGTDSVAVFVDLANEIGIDEDELQSCVESEQFADIVDAGLQEGQRLGVTGTPTFFINGEKLVGAQPIQAFEQVIQKKLNQQSDSSQ